MKKIKHKIDVFNEDTLAFLQKHLTNKDLRVLEVGCGFGDLGFELLKTGINLTALDVNEEAVKSAIEKGVPALNIDFSSFQSEPFDIIIFTRSLHHIHNLEEVLKHSKSLLKKGGKLIIEDFDLEMIDLKTARWYYDMRTLLATMSKEHKFTKFIKYPINQWEKDHVHNPPLHTGKEMIANIKNHFNIIEIERNAYLYRSISRHINNNKGYNVTKQILEIEKGLIENNFILPNGLRCVAKN